MFIFLPSFFVKSYLLLNNVLLLVFISLLFTEIDSKTIKEWCNGLKNHKFTTSSPPNLRITQAGTRIRLHPLSCDENSRQMTQIHSLGFWMRKKLSSFLRWLEEELGVRLCVYEEVDCLSERMCKCGIVWDVGGDQLCSCQAKQWDTHLENSWSN